MHEDRLWESDRAVDVSPRDAVHVVHQFLRHCREWATTREIPRRATAVADGAGPEAAARLHAWVAYAAFIDHTLGELEEGTLDHWFDKPVAPSTCGTVDATVPVRHEGDRT